MASIIPLHLHLSKLLCRLLYTSGGFLRLNYPDFDNVGLAIERCTPLAGCPEQRGLMPQGVK